MMLDIGSGGRVKRQEGSSDDTEMIMNVRAIEGDGMKKRNVRFVSACRSAGRRRRRTPAG